MAAKRPRREAEVERISLEEALSHDFFGDWPSPALEKEFWERFWEREDIPAELREPPSHVGTGADPRWSLSDDPAVRQTYEKAKAAHERRVSEFQSARRAWLWEEARR